MSPGRYAVWAELVDRTTSQSVIFVNVHTSFARADYALRGREIKNLMAAVGRLNTEGRTVVYAGDFNSNKNRGTYSAAAGFGSQDTVGRTFAAAGYYDAYDLARSLYHPNWNSFSGLSSKPIISRTWGDHVDHVYVRPGRTRVTRWMNAAPTRGSRYVAPIPSDHRAVMVNLNVS
jgi:endonuclease/exonuclease/phosphatase family metal-dependent hydrolase